MCNFWRWYNWTYIPSDIHFPFSHTCNMSCTFLRPWCHHSNNSCTWWRIQTMKLLCNFLHPFVTSSCLGPNTLSTLFSHTVYVLPLGWTTKFHINIKQQVIWHSAGKIEEPRFLNERWKDMVLNCINVLLGWSQISLICHCISRYFNSVTFLGNLSLSYDLQLL